MSPEQAQGKKVDTRSDIFSFGVVLYEMLTGARAFSGDSALSTLSAILRDEHKPMVEIAPDVPPQLELLIKRCLRKNPDERWQSMKDVLAALGALKHESDSGQLYRSRIQAVEMTPQAAGGGGGSEETACAAAGGDWRVWSCARRGRWRRLVVDEASHSSVAAPPVVVEVPIPARGSRGGADAGETPPAEAVMNNDSIIELVTSKVPASVILSQIRASERRTLFLRPRK